jgi:threonine synthase
MRKEEEEEEEEERKGMQQQMCTSRGTVIEVRKMFDKHLTCFQQSLIQFCNIINMLNFSKSTITISISFSNNPYRINSRI